MAFVTSAPSGKSGWACRIEELAGNLIGSRVDLVGRNVAVATGIAIVTWLLKEPRLLGWLGLFVIGQVAMFGWILTRRADASKWDYVVALLACALNSVIFLALPVGLWLLETDVARFSAAFFLVGFGIYAITRNGTMPELAVIDALPVVVGAGFIVTNYAAKHLEEVHFAVPLSMLGIVLAYYLLNMRENFVTRQRLKAAEEAAVEAARHQVVARLTAGVAHDFNNILTAVLGHIDLHDALSDPREKTESLRAAHTAATRAARLTGQLMVFAGKARLENTRTDLAVLLRNFAERNRRLLPQNIALHTNLPDGLAPVMVDRDHLDHTLEQLLHNASDSMPTGGTVTLSLGQIQVAAPRKLHGKTRLAKGDYCVITIADEGRGIMPQDVEQVYEPFFSTKKKGQASGLGLSMAAGFAAQSGGAIGLVSRPGEGTVVSFYLPAMGPAGPLD
ncbi:MAG: hypothetical protein GW886_09520 [Rhodobacterales bacterium]|nr:hypothetical protein [Rhodobacterales bacterium]